MRKDNSLEHKYTSSIIAKPFVKWAGGKTQLLNEIRKKYPKTIDKYCEPFVGGGAVLFDVLSNFQPKEVLINDINKELINTYIQIRDNVSELIDMLSNLQKSFIELDSDNRKIMFLDKRKRYNELKIYTQNLGVEIASLFIFLNKTCFNGLYRVNKKGAFNVPIGSYKNPMICDEKNLRNVSHLLKNVQISCGDYKNCKNFIDTDTFVYIDPPYRPLTATSSFTSYSKCEFGDKQQIELGKFITKISIKGAKVVASNSDPKNVDESDNFFDEIYNRFDINRIKATRMINSKGSNRGTVSELLICNY